jgi:enamine deaminase RidA (YjgF/YER057c/UK114 family)
MFIVSSQPAARRARRVAGAIGEGRDEIDVGGREAAEQIAARVAHVLREVDAQTQEAVALLEQLPVVRLEVVADRVPASHQAAVGPLREHAAQAFAELRQLRLGGLGRHDGRTP